MSFLTKGISAVLGGGEGAPAAELNGADAVERLVDRLQSSTLLEDRRDAIRGLKGLSKQFKLEVGTQGMDALITVIDKDRTDTEMVTNGLEALLNVTCAAPAGDGKQEGDAPPDSDLGVQFTEIFVKRQENIAILLGLLEEYDFPVRWPTVKLLTTLLANKTVRVQECVLESPGSVPRLMDLLSDNREIIRNDGLLLLSKLSSHNTQIQRMIAFSTGLERLLEIISEESFSDGGIVVEDCVQLMLNLIVSNSSNQSYFREANLVPRLLPFFEFPAESGEWPAQKIRNVVLLLRLVRAFVSPIQSQAQSTPGAQRAFAQCGIFRTLCQLMFATNLDHGVIVEVMGAVAELMRGDADNQTMFLQVTASQRPALLAIILMLVAEKRPVDQRLAALYCLQCVLLRNQAVQTQIVATLMPSDDQTQANSVTAGQLLCRGLFSGDEVMMWCSSAALIACMETPANKEELLRVQLSVAEGSTVALIHQAVLLAARRDLPCRSRTGLLLLVTHWLHECPSAVGKLLSLPQCAQFLTSAVEEQPDSQEQIIVRGLAALLLGLCLLAKGVTVTGDFTQQSLLEISQRRIRPENFTEALSAVSQSEVFMHAGRSHYPPAGVIFDYQYVQLFRQNSDNVQRIVRGEIDIASSPPSPHSARRSPEPAAASTHIMEHDAVVASYKELIRDQDSQLISMREELESIQQQRANEAEERADLGRELKELRNGNGAAEVDGAPRQEQVNGDGSLGEIMAANASMSHQLEEMTAALAQLKQERGALQAQLQSRQSADQVQQHRETSTNSAEVERLQQALRQAEQRLSELRETVSRREEEVTSLSGRLQFTEQQHQAARQQVQSVRAEFQGDDGDDLRKELTRVQAALQELQYQHGKLGDQTKSLETEHEDLLVLLSEQDAKITKTRARLVELGEVVSASEGEYDDDDEDSDEAGDED